jgi:DNA-binding IclR family transcriptional regulator
VRPSDAKVFDVFSVDDCRSILDLLIDSREPLTQGQIAQALKLKSSQASRRMAEIEGAGLVTRASAHAPYELIFRDKAQTMLELGADIGTEAAERIAAEASELRKERRMRRMRGSALPTEARETS